MPDTPKALRILAVMSSPTILKRKSDKDPIQKIPRLEIEKEWQALCKAVEGSPVRLERCYPPTLNQMDEMISRAASPEVNAPYQVVHFSGHGDISNLIFEDGCLQGVAVKAEKLGEIFKNSGVKLVILSACYSGVEETSQSIVSPASILANTYIPAVVCTNQWIRDDVACVFSKALFSHISTGFPMKESFNFAQRQIENDPDIRGAQKTVLELACPNDFVLDKVPVEPSIIDQIPPQIHSRYFQNDYFFGREEELADISLAMGKNEHKIITVKGIGGSGKSTLVREVAKRNCWRYTGGMVWADFRNEKSISPERLLLAVQEQLNVEISELQKRTQKIMARLESKPCLIIADNIETIITACRVQSQPQCQEANALAELFGNMPPAVQVLCTGREPLGLKGERVIDIVGLDPVAGLRLFIDVAEDKGRSLKKLIDGLEYVEEADKEKIYNVNKVIFNLPLCIYLACSAWARTPSMNLDTLAKGLKKSCREILCDPSMTDEDAVRHKSMVGTIEFSYRMLESDSAKQLLPRLSIFTPGSGFDDDAVKEICQLNNWDKGLEELVRKSLVEREWLFDKEYARYRLFPPVQEYAQEKLDGELKPLLDEKFSIYYAGISAYGYSLIENGEDIRSGALLLELELDNILRALDLSIDKGWSDQVGDLMNGLDRFYGGRFAYDMLKDVILKVIGFYKRIGDRNNFAVSLHEMGCLAQQQNRFEQARECYEQSLAIKTELGDRAGKAATLHQMGILAQEQNRYEEARDYYTQSLAISKELRNRAFESSTLHQMGILAQHQKQFDQARECYEQSLAISRELGNRTVEAMALHEMGILVQEQNQYKQARECYEESLAISRELGDRAGEARTLHQMGQLAQDQNQYEQAFEFYEQSIAIKRELGSRAGEAITLWAVGDLYEKQDKAEESLPFYITSLTMGVNLNSNEIIYGVLGRLFDYIITMGKNDFSSLFLKKANELMEDKQAKALLKFIFDFYDKIDD